MEREISSGAMLGVVLLALAAVIGLGFMVFAIAKGIANEGTVNMQDSLATVSDQVFLDYDQKVVTGTQALAALNTFEGKPYAVLYGTRALNQNATVDYHPEHGGAPDKVFGTKGSGGTTPGTGFYVNYNALIDGNLTYSNGSFVIEGLQQADGAIKFYNVTPGLYKTGNGEYINSSSKFDANVIKDTSDNYAGVVFLER